jgi:hypothetical protein
MSPTPNSAPSALVEVLGAIELICRRRWASRRSSWRSPPWGLALTVVVRSRRMYAWDQPAGAIMLLALALFVAIELF